MKHDHTPVSYQPNNNPVGHYQPNQGYAVGYGSYQDIEEEAGGFDPLKIFWFIVHYRWLVSAFIVAGVLSGLVYNYLQTPMYRATTKVEIISNGAKVFQDLEVVSQTSDFRAFETARQKMLTRELAQRVVFELNLSENKQFLAPTPSFSLKNILKRILGTSNQTDIDDLTAEQRESRAIGLVNRNLSISIIRNTSILAVSYTHADRVLAADVVNQVARSYIAQSVDKKSETSTVAREFIAEQAKQTKDRLQESEKALVEYAQSAGITVTGDERSLISSSIAEINTALSEAIQERLSAERYALQVESGNAATLPEVFESESIQITKQKIAELRATYQQKLSTLKPGFPEMRRLNAQINELSKQVNIEVQSIAKSIEIKLDQARAKESALKEELASLEERQSDFQNKNIQYTILKREVDSNRSQYESLIGKLNEVGVGSELNVSNTSIVDVALPPGAPFSPRLLFNLIGALTLFGIGAAVTIYILEMLNNTFSVPDQLEAELKLPVLGIIPHLEEFEFQTAFDLPTSALSEAYRTLRTSLQFTAPDGQINSLMVTSSGPSEGKTTTCYKLAKDFAALGLEVLVIDADLRKPRMHHMFKTTNGIGLSNLLTNVVPRGDVPKIFRETDDPKIHFLSAGTIPPNPADLLVSQKMGLAIHYTTKKYDMVIIDCPPVMGLADAPIISRQVDAVLMVVSCRGVSRKAAANAVSRLRSAGASLVGSAMTKFKVNQLDYNYSYRYMQYNYYAYEGEGDQDLLEDHSGNVKADDNQSSKDNFISDFFGRFRNRRT